MQLQIHFNRIMISFYKTALFSAIENDNLDIVKLLLSDNRIDINILNVFY